MSGITFDAGGLIALDRNDRRVLVLIARAMERRLRVTIPATVLAQAIRNAARQARLSRLIRQPGTDLVSLDGPDATAVGLLLTRTATADIVDAHVVICAQRTGQLSVVLYGVSPRDPSTFLVALLIVAIVALLACWQPALRAIQIDPALTLREE